MRKGMKGAGDLGQQIPVDQLPPPKFLYRYFDEEHHAQALVGGRVWLSTLEWCRKCDDIRLDADEGKLYWDVPDTNPALDPQLAAKVGEELQRLKVVKGGEGAVFNNCKVNLIVADGLIFCTSLDSGLKNFGRYCVRIADPLEFYRLVTIGLRQVVPIQDTQFAPMSYMNRRSGGIDGPALHPAFNGPPGNAKEREARMLWLTNDGVQVQRFELHVPEVAALCSRIR